MTRSLTRTLALSALCAGVLWAADFWETKGFSEWNEKQVRKMLTNSPWAREVKVGLPRPGGRPGGGGFGDRGGFGGGGGGADQSGAGRGGGMPSRESMSRPAPTMSLIVRWQSARPIKQALVKNRFGDEAADAKEGNDYIDREEKYYIVHISGLPARMGRIAEKPDQLKERSRLKRKNKEDIVPELVEVRPTEQFVQIYLLFPRTDPITLDDKNVEVVMELGPMNVKRRFKLKDMVFDGKLSL